MHDVARGMVLADAISALSVAMLKLALAELWFNLRNLLVGESVSFFECSCIRTTSTLPTSDSLNSFTQAHKYTHMHSF